MELLLALGVIYVVAHLIYRNGKREGSEKLFASTPSNLLVVATRGGYDAGE